MSSVNIFDNSANAMTANYRNGLIFNSQLVVNNNSSFNSQQNNHSLDFISDQYYGEGYQNATIAFSSTQSRVPIYRSVALPAFTRTTNFSANYLNGCFVWLDAADYYTTPISIDQVQNWSDKSSSSMTFPFSAFSPLIALNALNGKNTIFFNTGRTYIRTSTLSIGTNSFAMFVVCRFNSITDNLMNTVFAKSKYGTLAQEGRFAFYKETTNKIVMFLQHGSVDSPDNVGFTIANTGYNIYSFVCNRVAGNDTVYYNGTAKISRSYTSDIATNLTNTYDFCVGCHNSESGTGLLSTTTKETRYNGNIAEILCFRTPTDMTEATRQKIEGYLAWKWDLMANLPINHPWLYDQPTFGLQS